MRQKIILCYANPITNYKAIDPENGFYKKLFLYEKSKINYNYWVWRNATAGKRFTKSQIYVIWLIG